MTDQAAALSLPTPLRRLADIISRNGLWVTLAVIVAAFSFLAPNFMTLSNIMNVLLQSSNIGIMAAGLTLVVICGEIDLSVASLQSLGACIVAILVINMGVPIPIAMVAAILAGGLAGLVSGTIVGTFAVPAFIITLAMDSFGRGIALIITNQNSVFGFPQSFSVFGQGYLGPVPVAALIAGFVFFVLHIVLSRTVLGTNIYAVGGNREAARLAGINIFAVKVAVLTISGLCGTTAGVLMASRLMAAQPIMGMFDLMDVIAAVVIGGASLLGGEGRMLGTILGTLIITFIRNGLNLMGIPADWQLIAIGIIIVIAVLTDFSSRRANAG
ncbi:ABC transporter permease [Ancylobacter sp. G4_0304]|uniref:ABC transporter permease n=1 Tax=Ancylobacter sp. G4_0304 TaxID=3114289 RepID=UPI0039C6F1F2